MPPAAPHANIEAWTRTPSCFRARRPRPPEETRSGDLVIEGYGAVWQGLDKDNENFLRGAFRDTLPTFLSAQAPLLFVHDGTKGLGRVLEAREDDKGLWIKARVDHQEPGSPLRWIYNAVKRGTYRGLSAGG